jgi:hypothetical protein
VKIVCVGVISCLILAALGYMVTGGRGSITGSTMRDLYAQQRVDLVFLGSSTVYESCDPAAFDAELDISAFNAATPAQTMRESYYQLKEVCRLYRPGRVLLGVDPWRIMEPIERDSLSSSYLFDNMRWSAVKAEFMADAFDLDYYPSALFPIVRLRENVTMKDIEDAIKGRLSRRDNSTKLVNPSRGGAVDLHYEGKGYVANLQAIEDGTLPEAPPLGFSGPDSVAAGPMGYLTKIGRLCEENGMELTFFQTPLLPGATEWVGDYAAYHDFIADRAKGMGAGFMDFNYLDPGIIAYEDGMFSDLEHTTADFARRFSDVFAGLLAGDGTERGTGAPTREDAFFTGYGTYLDLYKAVASTWVTEADADSAGVASVGTASPEYRVAVLTDDEDMEPVRTTDWQTGREAAYPALEPGDYIVTVEARPLGDEEAEPKGNWKELHVD